METQSNSFETNLTISKELIDNSYESKFMRKIIDTNDNSLNIRKYTSANVARVSSTISVSTTSNETASKLIDENGITKKLQLQRSNTTPFQSNSKLFKPTYFIKYKSFQTKVEDTKELIDILKASINQPMSFPPIVVEQLKKNQHDPYINNFDPKFWSIIDTNEKNYINKILRENINKRFELKNKDSKGEDKKETRSTKRAKSESKNRKPNERLSATSNQKSSIISNSQKLPPIDAFENNEIKLKEIEPIIPLSRKESIFSRNDSFQSKNESNDDKNVKSEEPVKNIIMIDSLDDIDRPGVFLPSTATGLRNILSGKNIKKHLIDHNIQFKNEIHIFMSSFFTDSEVERAAILVKVIPELRTIFASCGYELYYHDCHLGTNGIIDGQNLDSLCLNILNESMEKSNQFTENGIRFIVFFGQKFGNRNLPNRLSGDVFDNIFLATKQEHDKNRRISKFNKKPLVKNFSNLNSAISIIESIDENATVVNNPVPLTPGPLTPGPLIKELTSNSIATNATNNTADKPVEESKAEDQIGELVVIPKSRLKSRRQSFKDLIIDLPVFQTQREETKVEIQPPTPENNTPITQPTDIVDPSVLTQWYELDKSESMPVYILKPISTVIPDINNKKDSSKREIAIQQFQFAKKNLLKLFEKYGSTNINLTSTPQKEIKNFIKYYELHADKAVNSHARLLLSIERSICEYDLQAVNDSMLQNYFDIKTQFAPEIDKACLSQIKKLKHDINETVLQKSNMEFIVNWSPDIGISPIKNREHFIYIERLCKQFKENFLRSWDFLLKKKTSKKEEALIDFDNEIKQHRLFFYKQCISYLGPRNTILDIKSYVRSLSNVPLFIIGDHGSGKTSLLNECMKEIEKNDDIKLVVRCCGKTELSTNIRLFLKNLNDEIDSIYTENNTKETGKNTAIDLPTLKNTFINRLLKATSDNQLVIILDGIDNLKNDYDEQIIDWIPRELPPNVHIIISFNPTDDKGVKLSNYVKKNFGKNNNNIIKIESFMMNKDKCDDYLLKKFIKNETQDDLNEQLIELLIDYFKELVNQLLSTLNPLFCRIIIKYYKNVLTYNTFFDVMNQGFNKNLDIYKHITLKSILDQFLLFLERKYNDAYVKRALGYIAAFQYCGGITENELLDLLSLDDAVLSSINNDSFSYKCVPEIYWIALKSILNEFDYLLEVHNTGGYRCILLKNTIFYETINDRYFQQRDKAPSYHKAIVNYYSNKHNDKDKIQAIKQPVEQIATIGGQKYRIANMRRLKLFSYHLSLSAPSIETIKQEMIFNYVYLESKLSYIGYEALIDDINLMLYSNSETASMLQADSEIKLFLEFLDLSESAFRIGADQLYSQLVGRLSTFLASVVEKKIPQEDEQNQKPQEAQFNYIKILMNECKIISESNDGCLLPNSTFMIQPGLMTCERLRGFSHNIASLTTSHDGSKLLTFEIDGVCKLWDMKSLRLMKTLHKIKDFPKQVRLAMGNLYIITVTHKNKINIWNIRTGEKLFSIQEDEIENVQITLGGSPEFNYLVVCLGCKILTNWNLTDFKKIKSINLQEIENDKQNTEETLSTPDKNIFDSKNCLGTKIVLSKSCFEDNIGFAFRGTNTAFMFNAKTGSITQKYITKFESGFISAIELTSDYFVIICKLTRNKGSDIYKIELHEIKQNKLARIVEGCFNDNLIDISLNLTGSHLIGICYSEITQTSEIAYWNIESEEHRHLCLRGTTLSPNLIISNDLRFVLTSSVGHFDSDAMEAKHVKIWNLAAKFGKPGGKYLSYDDDGIEYITIGNNDQSKYALTHHFQNKRVCIWNLETIGNKYEEPKIPKLVFEQGLNVVDKKIVFKPNDVILTYEDINLIYILTDKGSSESDGGESTPIFESICVYNLKEDKLEYKVQKSFICAYDAHEYLIVPNKSSKTSETDIVLVGLSETRNHFMITSIITGHVLKRMKTNFREERLKKINARQTLVQSSTDLTSVNEFVEESDLDVKDLKNIEQFIVSLNHEIIVASYHSFHLCVFDLNTFSHIQTLEDTNCLLLLYVSHLTSDGTYLINQTYDTKTKSTYLTIWNCKTGKMKRRLKNETNVISIVMSDDANHVIFCKQNGDVKYWNPFQHNSLRTMKRKKKLNFDLSSTKIEIIKNNTQAIIISGKNISLWDIKNCCMINIFTNDFKFTCYSIILNDTTVLFGDKNATKPVCLRLP